MNYNTSLFSILLICLLSCFALKPALESYAGFQVNAKKALVFGEIHATSAAPESPLAKVDTIDSKIIFSFIKNISSLPLPTKFILELSNAQLEQKERSSLPIKDTEEFKNLHNDLYYGLASFAKTNNFSFGTISFSLANDQGSISRNFAELFMLTDCPLFRDPQMFFNFKDQIKEFLGTVGTIEEFFQEIQTQIEQLTMVLNFDLPREVTSFLKNILKQAIEYKRIGENSFTAEEFKICYIDVFAMRCLASQNIQPIFEPLYEWVLPLFDSLLDCDLIIRTAQALETNDQVIIFAGNNHAITLHNFLKHYDFEPVIIQGLTKKSTGIVQFEGPRFDRQVLVNFLSNIFSKNSANQSEKQITDCALCDKPNSKNRCGRCKISYYCSPECQKKHWSSHKAECKKK